MFSFISWKFYKFYTIPKKFQRWNKNADRANSGVGAVALRRMVEVIPQREDLPAVNLRRDGSQAGNTSHLSK